MAFFTLYFQPRSGERKQPTAQAVRQSTRPRTSPKGAKEKTPYDKNLLVPSKGLEPPHPCEYMDLNHARLPIPPRWQVDLHCSSGPKAADQEDLHFYSTDTKPRVKPPVSRGIFVNLRFLSG